MQMSDGGFRPAYNVQFATTTDTKIIVGIDVINQGNDAGQMQPMIGRSRSGSTSARPPSDRRRLLDQERHRGHGPDGHATVYTPVKEEAQQKAKGQDPFARRRARNRR